MHINICRTMNILIKGRHLLNVYKEKKTDSSMAAYCDQKVFDMYGHTSDSHMERKVCKCSLRDVKVSPGLFSGLTS